MRKAHFVSPWLLATLAFAAPAYAHERNEEGPDNAGRDGRTPVNTTAVNFTLAHPATPTVPAGNSGNPLDAGEGPLLFDADARAGVATGPGDCVGPNCSDYDLFVGNPGVLTPNVKVRIDWTNVANDYDMYIFQQTAGEPQVASSGNGTTTFEEAIFTPLPNTTYQIVIVHFAATGVGLAGPETIDGVISLVGAPVVTNPNRTGPSGTGIVFSPNGNIFVSTTPAVVGSNEAPTGRGTTFAEETVRDGEPSIRSDAKGNVYPAGIRGVPAGVDVWRFGPNAFCPRFNFYDDDQFPIGDPPALASNPGAGYVWLGQPDGIFVTEGEGSPDAGGGDIELAVNPIAGMAGEHNLSMVSLTLANITSSHDPATRGNNFTLANPVAATVPLDDRQWIDAYGEKTVYLYYRTLATLTGLILNKSVDGGQTFIAGTNVVNPLGLTPGWIAVDKRNAPAGPALIYMSGQNSSELRVFRCSDTMPGSILGVVTCNAGVVVDNTMSHGHIFDPVAVGNNGDVYVAWSNNKDIFYSVSTDYDTNPTSPTFSQPIQVTTAGVGGMPAFNFFPWITAGDDGRIGIVWYGTTNGATTNADNDAEWKAFYAFTSNAKATTPSLLWLPASDHVIHKSNVSQAGLSTDAAVNRNLIDFFEVAHDPRDGAAIIAFGDDHNDFDGATYYTRQIKGPGLRASTNATQSSCPPLQPFRSPEVVDFKDASVSADVDASLIAWADILEIDYNSRREDAAGFPVNTGGDVYVIVEFTTFQLPPPTPTSYRAYFSVNTVRGLYDSGNEYFIEFTTEFATPQVFLGVTDRNPDGTTSELRVKNITLDQMGGFIATGAPATMRLRVKVSDLSWLYDVDLDSNPGTPDVIEPTLNPTGSPVPPIGSLVIGLKGRTREVVKTPLANPNATPPPTPIVSSLFDETRGGSFILVGQKLNTTQNVPFPPGFEVDALPVTVFGGWAPTTSETGLEYYRNVASAGGSASRPFMEFQFPGGTTSVQYGYLTGSRGGGVEVFIDGQSRGTIDQYRATTDPTGKTDLAAASKTFTVPAQPGPHTFRVEARTDLASGTRNVSTVYGFAANGGPVGTGSMRESSVSYSERLGRGASLQHVMVADPSTTLLTAVVEPTDGAYASNPLTVEVVDATGKLMGTALNATAPRAVSVAAPAPGNYTVRLVNTGDRTVGYRATFIRSQWAN